MNRFINVIDNPFWTGKTILEERSGHRYDVDEVVYYEEPGGDQEEFYVLEHRGKDQVGPKYLIGRFDDPNDTFEVYETELTSETEHL